VLRFQINTSADIEKALVDGESLFAIDRHNERPGVMRLDIPIPDGAKQVRLSYYAEFEDDIEAGERPGEVHNFSVDAHIGDNGVFLSDGAVWHPQPVDESGELILHHDLHHHPAGRRLGVHRHGRSGRRRRA
jgi:hypothetical protein